MLSSRRLITIVWGFICTCTFYVFGQYNYAQALQMSQYFYEAQESGTLSPNNRVPWRGPAHLNDGADVGRDLSGGWYDAGDHWKSNNTMAYAAAILAWGGLRYAAVYDSLGQMDELLANLRYVNDYFLKCIVDAQPNDTVSFEGYELYIDIGGNPGPQPGLHSVWASPEVIEGFTVREAVKATNQYPASDVAGSMGAAMAASAIVFNKYGSDPAYAETVCRAAAKLTVYADRYLETFNTVTVTDTGILAVAPSGAPRRIDYRDGNALDNVMFARLWLHRAQESFGDESYDGGHFARAIELQESNLPYWDLYGWWKDLFISQFNCAIPVLFLQIAPQSEYAAEWKPAATAHIEHWMNLEPSPAGLKVRGEYGGSFSLKWVHGQTFLAVLYAQATTDADLAAQYRSYAQSQVDYTLGDNAQGKSFVIGFGDKGWFNTPHHRGAHGVWKNFEHLMEGKPEYNVSNARHVLYGALMGGPDRNDSFEPDIGNHGKNEVALDFNAAWQGTLAGLIAAGHGTGDVLPDTEFPPVAERNQSTDLIMTDREFFVSARIITEDNVSLTLESTIFNRTRWPARVTDSLEYRLFFTLDANVPSHDISVSLANAPRARAGDVREHGNGVCSFAVSFPDAPLRPFWVYNDTENWTDRRTVTVTIQYPQSASWDRTNDWSLAGLTAEEMLHPTVPVYYRGELVGGDEPEIVSTFVHPKTGSIRTAPLPIARYNLTGRKMTFSGFSPASQISVIEAQRNRKHVYVKKAPVHHFGLTTIEERQ